MDLANLVSEFEPSFFLIQESKIEGKDGSVLGWHATGLTAQGIALGSGFHSSREMARRISISELLERAVFRIGKTASWGGPFLLKEFPSTSGFAAGFDSKATRIRAVLEAHERWAWSKWIDDGFRVEEVTGIATLSKLSTSLLGVFDSIRFFHCQFMGDMDLSGQAQKLHFGVLLGLKDDGVFPGSRVAMNPDDIWDHAAVEAWRHHQLTRVNSSQPQDIIQKRAHYFSTRSSEALRVIDGAKIQTWPRAELRFLGEVPLNKKSFFVWRALPKDFIGWHLGDETRFVY